VNNITEEDITAAKLKGYNCYIKFHDGEILFLKSELLEEEDERDWSTDTENFINGKEGENFPCSGIAVDRKSIKYVKVL